MNDKIVPYNGNKHHSGLVNWWKDYIRNNTNEAIVQYSCSPDSEEEENGVLILCIGNFDKAKNKHPALLVKFSTVP